MDKLVDVAILDMPSITKTIISIDATLWMSSMIAYELFQYQSVGPMTYLALVQTAPYDNTQICV